jgi:hypothetical protein
MCITMNDGKNALPQYSDNKQSHGVDDSVTTHPCEHVPYESLAAWMAIDAVTPILAGEQHPPMATFIASPTFAEAVDHCVRVSAAIALIHH